ncbi:hypothetical protein [Nonomuraea indica]|uniref:Uncharacterized protein n=1 Tax=Nonomuraea indica TaxID=1581193 RepID=A0ABW8A1Q9_9ACTN
MGASHAVRGVAAFLAGTGVSRALRAPHAGVSVGPHPSSRLPGQ